MKKHATPADPWGIEWTKLNHAGGGAYNGVAIASLHPVDEVLASGEFGDEHLDREPRLISCVVHADEPVRVVSAYVPHGREVGHWHYEYKLAFLAALVTDVERMALDMDRAAHLRYQGRGDVAVTHRINEVLLIELREDLLAQIGCHLVQSHRRIALHCDGINVDEPVFLKKLTKQARRQMEQKIILKAMETNQWNRKKTARFLNISYRALLYKLKEAGVLSKRANGNQPEAELGTDMPGPV